MDQGLEEAGGPVRWVRWGSGGGQMVQVGQVKPSCGCNLYFELNETNPWKSWKKLNYKNVALGGDKGDKPITPSPSL